MNQLSHLTEIVSRKKLLQELGVNSRKEKEEFQLNLLIESFTEDGIDQDKIDVLIDVLKNQWQIGRNIDQKMVFLKANLLSIF